MKALRTVDRQQRLHAVTTAVTLGGSPMAERLQGLQEPFPKVLERALKKRGWSPRTLGRFIKIKGVDEKKVLSWLNGEAFPIGDEWAMCKAHLHEVTGARGPRDKNAAPVKLDELQRADQLLEHEIRALERDRRHHENERYTEEQPPREWGTAFWYFRVLEGLTVKQIAKYMDCSDTAVLHWQSGHSTPVAENVRQLHDLLPKLAAAVADGTVNRPPMRDIPKPGRATGRAVTLTVEQPAAQTTQPELKPEAMKPPATATITPIRRVEDAPMPVAPMVILAPLPVEPAPAPAPVAVAQPAPAPVTPISIARPGESDQDRIHRELFDAMRAEAEAKKRHTAATKALEDLQLSVMQAEEDMTQARQAREAAHAALERIAAASID